jgi:phosphoglycerate dehydrogenase-like enzyme
MKESAIFVNVGRGSVVSLDVLTNALVAKKIEAALLDVYEVEPLPQEHPLWKLDNVIMTPHISGTFEIEESRKRFIDLVISNLKSLENKETLQNIVNKQAQY